MASRRPTRTSGESTRWLAGALVAVLAIGTIVLVVLAVQSTRPVQTDVPADPVPTFTFGPRPTASPTSVPEPVETVSPPAAVTQPADAQRFLAVGSGSIWRGVAGDCGGASPLIERSADGGATWTNVTPAYRDIRQLISLDTFAQIEAEIVAAVGDGCQTQVLRTFTQGEFWEQYPEVLAAARYLDPAATRVVVTPQGPIEAPCAEPRDLRAQGDVVALVCDGAAQRLVDGAWVSLPVPDVVALAVAGDTLLTAATAPDCAGAVVAAWSGDFTASSVIGCAADVDPAAPLALAVDGDAVVLWSGDTLTRLG